MNARNIVLLMGLAACGGPQKGSDSCRAASERVGVLYHQQQNARLEDKARLTDLLTERCDQDGWADAAKSCLIALAPGVSFESCAPHWTEPQTANLDRALKAFEADVRARANKGS